MEGDRLTLPRSTFTDLASALSHEWLVTNGLGGFASGSVAQANTRRYHGLLVASLRPPVERVVMVARLDAVARHAGRSWPLSCNEFADGTIAPRGFEQLADFRLEGVAPLWTFALGEALLEQRIWMAHGSNTTYVSLRLLHANAAVDLELTPLCTYRDYHAETQGSWAPRVDAQRTHCTVTAFAGARPYRLAVDRGDFQAAPQWYWRFRHRAEAQRGLDAEENLFRPGIFHARLQPGESVTFTATAEATDAERPALAMQAHQQRTRQLLHGVAGGSPAWIRRLVLAADAYLVARADEHGQLQGRTVIAGYPWFSDWGRDTMIALPGLTLATRRHEDAVRVLRTFALHVSDGMLPNRFPDSGEAPEYNTVDATLWYFHAIQCHLDATGDLALLRDLFPVLQDIVRWHQRGTRHGIRVDHGDGLLRAGEPGVQLTWMDARVGDRVVTPRIGKPVEVNALWHFAVSAMARWAERLGDAAAAARYASNAAQITLSFRRRFWNERSRCLYDVIDVPDRGGNDAGREIDASLRPNQIFAVSLGTDLLDASASRAVVECCARELLTPMGLRSLSPADAAYVARYQGGPRQRDGSYHQGTVWSWLLGPFVLAHYRVYADAAHARSLLAPLAAHLAQACVGQISEIFDAEAPHAPRGCVAQAWSVGETLRAWAAIDATAPASPRGAHHA